MQLSPITNTKADEADADVEIVDAQSEIQSQEQEPRREVDVDEECMSSSDSNESSNESESDDEEDREIEDQQTRIEANEGNEQSFEPISNAEPSLCDNVNESTFINDEIHEANDFISFKRGDTENVGDDGSGLQYIDSFLRGIDTSTNANEQEQLQYLEDDDDEP